MRRLLLCLCLCLVLGTDVPQPAPPRPEAALLPDVADNGQTLPDAAVMERLAPTDPIAFLKNCLIRYDREVQSYRCVLERQERIDGKLQPIEVTDVYFREQPFSVRMDWRQGARLAQRVLYVRGEYRDRLLVLPTILPQLVGVVQRDPDGPDARRSGRYPLTEFGIKIGTQRTLAAWERADREGTLHIEFLGERPVPEAGGRLCWVFRRLGYRRPEEDGIAWLEIHIDKENWLQVGSILKDPQGQLIGSYFFRDIRLNPTFGPGTFTRAGLKNPAPPLDARAGR